MSQIPLRKRYEQPSLSITRYTSGLPKVVIVHSHRYLAEIVRLVLRDEVEVVAETSSGRAAVALAELFEPDVMITGETFGDGVIESVLPGLFARDMRVVVIGRCNDSRKLRLVSLGAIGVIDEQSPLDSLTNGVREVLSGGAALPPSTVATIINQWRASTGLHDAGGLASLTQREREVINEMALGLSSKAIAARLDISVKTVESHKTRIFSKLGVRTQSAAVAKALRSPDERPAEKRVSA